MVNSHTILTTVNSQLRYSGKLENRQTISNYVIAQAIAYSLPIPTEVVRSHVMWFNNLYRVRVMEVLSEVNEEYPINLDVIYDTVVSIASIRYQVAVSPESVDFRSLMSVRGVSAIPEKDLAVLEDDDTRYSMQASVKVMMKDVRVANNAANAPSVTKGE